MENTVKKVLNTESYDENQYYSEIVDICYSFDGEEDLDRCKVIHQIGLELEIDDIEILSEIIMFCDIYKLSPRESLRCMDEGFVVFSDEMDEIMKFINNDQFNIDDAIENIKGNR